MREARVLMTVLTGWCPRARSLSYWWYALTAHRAGVYCVWAGLTSRKYNGIMPVYYTGILTLICVITSARAFCILYTLYLKYFNAPFYYYKGQYNLCITSLVSEYTLTLLYDGDE